MANEFEIVAHNQMHDFRLFLVNLLYRTPHIHKDFEICLILEGETSLLTAGRLSSPSAGSASPGGPST